ncbi:MAG: hypothetical protein AB1726_14385 [Planctomycetota bacterium]
METLLPPAADTLDLCATLSPDGRTLRLFAVNAAALPATRRIELAGFPPSRGPIRLFVLHDCGTALERSAANDFDDPARIGVDEAAGPQVEGGFEHSFPPLSVSVLEIGV